MNGSRAVRFDRQVTTAWLSDRKSTEVPRQLAPHAAALINTGTSSLTAMFTSAHDWGQWWWNQLSDFLQ